MLGGENLERCLCPLEIHLKIKIVLTGLSSFTYQRLTLSLASESGGMLLILFMVSISSLRSGWIWTNRKDFVKQMF